LAAILLALTRRTFVVQMVDAWLWARDWVRGKRPDFDLRFETFADRILAAAKTADADEILIVGHSCGTIVLPALVARLLERDPDLPSRTRLAVLGAGTCLPALVFDPAAQAIRKAVARLAGEPRLAWAELTSFKDVLGCDRFDPRLGAGLIRRSARDNPVLWRVQFRRMLKPDTYNRFHTNYFRLHYQYVMGNDQRYTYDYFALIAAPFPLAAWIDANLAGNVCLLVPGLAKPSTLE
jgi:pimeloyl-ACP methyl ester carboxylesterase